MVKLLRFNDISFFFFFAATTTSEAISFHEKISRFINSTTEGILDSVRSFRSGNTSTATPRRVWITYTKGYHVSVMSNMDIHRTKSVTMNPMFDFRAMNSIVTMATEEEIALLLANASSGVISVRDDPKRYPMTRDLSPSHHLRRVQQRNLQQTWDGQSTGYGIELTQVDQLRSATGLDGAGITVCVIDTGLDVTHEDFNTTGYSGVTLIDGSEWSSDSSGHGTHVSGIIAAADNTIGLVGVAPRATIYTVDIFGDNGYSYASALVDGVYRCRDAGAKIISMSLGGVDYIDQENTAFQELYNFNGMLSVAAAGNSGNNELSFPASYDNVLSVGAVGSSKTLASFSQYNKYVDLVAPGVGIWSTLPTSFCEICSEIGYTTYGPLDGTSQATPFVSGIAALLMSSNPSWSVETVTNALLNSAEDLGTAGRDDLYGYGLVSALRAYNLLNSSSGITASPATKPPISDPGTTTPSSPCAEATLFLRTDGYPYETFVSLYDVSSNVSVWSSGVDLANTDYSLSSGCLDANGCYEFTISDTVGDGLCCSYGLGLFKLSFNGVPVASGDEIGFGVTYLLGDGCQA
jgi:subtilisin family serine protease